MTASFCLIEKTVKQIENCLLRRNGCDGCDNRNILRKKYKEKNTARKYCGVIKGGRVMPWVTKFNQYASTKMKEYERLENNLIDKRKRITDKLTDARNCKGALKNKVYNMGDLSGDFLIKYENKRDDYFDRFTQIDNSFNAFLKDLNGAISQCNSKKEEWNSKIYTREWEEPEEEYNVGNQGYKKWPY